MSIKIKNVVLPCADQWEAVIRGMRNPMNSWNKSDTDWFDVVDNEDLNNGFLDYDNSNDMFYLLGHNDLDLMQRLCSAGSEHRKFMRMIPVYLDIIAPLYWWKEFDTYKVALPCNSCSTMHKIQSKEFTLDDFSHEHLLPAAKKVLQNTIDEMNAYRSDYVNKECGFYHDKDTWWQMIQLLPSSYNQRRTVLVNYEILVKMYHQRKNHKLDEWREFCEWIKTLPYSDLITMDK